MTTIEILRAAKALIEDESRWCCHSYSRDRKGIHCHPLSKRARKWCAYGACHRAAGVEATYPDELAWASRELFMNAPTVVNDVLGHAAVMRMFDRAIEIALGRSEE